MYIHTLKMSIAIYILISVDILTTKRNTYELTILFQNYKISFKVTKSVNFDITESGKMV